MATVARATLRHPVFVVVNLLQFWLVSVNGGATMALPAVSSGLGATSTGLQWFAALFGLGYSLVLVLSGRLGDLFGPRRLLFVGFALLCAGVTLCAIAPTVPILLLGRLIQGVAGGIVAPQTAALIQLTFTGHRRSTAFAVFLAVSGGAFMVGQLLTGGLITADLFGWGWRWAFIPFVIAGPISLLLATRVLPYIEPAGTGRPDLAGAGVLAVVSFLVMFPLIQGRNAGWPLWIVVMLLAALPIFWAFLRLERRIVSEDGDPLIDPSLFRIRTFALGNAITLLFSLIAAAGPLYLILTIQLGFGRNALEAALLTAPMPFANIGGSLVAAPLLRRFGRGALTMGALCTAASAVAVLIGVTGDASNPLVITPGVALLGGGLGISMAGSMAIVLGDVPPQHAGSASGVQGTGMQLASSIGIAVYGLLFYGEVGSDGGLFDYLDGARDAMMLTLVFVVLQLVLIPLLPRHKFGPNDELPLADPELLVMPDLHDAPAARPTSGGVQPGSSMP